MNKNQWICGALFQCIQGNCRHIEVSLLPICFLPLKREFGGVFGKFQELRECFLGIVGNF